MCRIMKIMSVLSIGLLTNACAIGLKADKPTPVPTMNCKVMSVSGDVVRTEGCQDWQPLQFGIEGTCMQVTKPKQKGDGSFVLKQSSTCRYFSLQHTDGRWLVITPAKANNGEGIYVLDAGKGLAFYAHSLAR